MYNFQKENAIKIPLCVAITHLTHIIKKNLKLSIKRERSFRKVLEVMKVFCFVIIITGLNRPNIGNDDGSGGGGDDDDDDYNSLEFIITFYSWSEEVTFQH
jgi:hypothetical protein